MRLPCSRLLPAMENEAVCASQSIICAIKCFQIQAQRASRAIEFRETADALRWTLRGGPSVAMASYALCMRLIHPAGGLAGRIARQSDHAALETAGAQVRAKRKPAAKPVQAARPGARIPVALGIAADWGMPTLPRLVRTWPVAPGIGCPWHLCEARGSAWERRAQVPPLSRPCPAMVLPWFCHGSGGHQVGPEGLARKLGSCGASAVGRKALDL